MSESVSVEQPETQRQGQRRWVSVLGWLAVLAAALPTFTRPLARLDWRLDLLTHFQVAHATFSVILAAILWRIRRKPAFVALFLAVVQVAPLVRYYWPNPVPPASGSSGKLRLVVLNVLVDNLNHQAVRELLTHEDPDLIGLIEYTPLWKSALEPVSRLYPFRFEAPDGPQGLALWSRVPLIEPRVERHTGTGWPCIHTRIEFAGQTVNVWLAHPSSPVRRMRDGGFPELAALGARVASVSGPRLVVGDLNTTSGSPLFGDFLRSSGLRDSRLGFGLQGTWPSPLPYRIAIDHALLSPELAVASRRIGPDVGSDHRPLILELAPSRISRHASTTESASGP